eukprot:scaffold5294_cov129-Cylindrotheca_fusiformis.AAC.2
MLVLVVKLCRERARPSPANPLWIMTLSTHSPHNELDRIDLMVLVESCEWNSELGPGVVGKSY